jgi:hypothetical protein
MTMTPRTRQPLLWAASAIFACSLSATVPAGTTAPTGAATAKTLTIGELNPDQPDQRITPAQAQALRVKLLRWDARESAYVVQATDVPLLPGERFKLKMVADGGGSLTIFADDPATGRKEVGKLALYEGRESLFPNGDVTLGSDKAEGVERIVLTMAPPGAPAKQESLVKPAPPPEKPHGDQMFAAAKGLTTGPVPDQSTLPFELVLEIRYGKR